MSVKPSRTRDMQAGETRTALLRVARRLFSNRGFPDVSVDQIVQAARVTKGALYHHFKDKEELFRAVVVEIEQEISTRLVAAASRQGKGNAKVRAACKVYLDA